jgi:hypothetical protein
MTNETTNQVCQRGVDGRTGCGHNEVGRHGKCVAIIKSATYAGLCGHRCDFSPAEPQVANDDLTCADGTMCRFEAVVIAARQQRATPSPTVQSAAEICAEMAREAESALSQEAAPAREPFLLQGLGVADLINGYFVGEGLAVMDTKTRNGLAGVIGMSLAHHAADALREAQRRIEAATPTAPDNATLASVATKLEEMRACENGVCTHCIDVLLEAQSELAAIIEAELAATPTEPSDKTISAQFHHVWTSQVGTEGYDKDQWQKLSTLLNRRGIRV